MWVRIVGVLPVHREGVFLHQTVTMNCWKHQPSIGSRNAWARGKRGEKHVRRACFRRPSNDRRAMRRCLSLPSRTERREGLELVARLFLWFCRVSRELENNARHDRLMNPTTKQTSTKHNARNVCRDCDHRKRGLDGWTPALKLKGGNTYDHRDTLLPSEDNPALPKQPSVTVDNNCTLQSHRWRGKDSEPHCWLLFSRRPS